MLESPHPQVVPEGKGNEDDAQDAEKQQRRDPVVPREGLVAATTCSRQYEEPEQQRAADKGPGWWLRAG